MFKLTINTDNDAFSTDAAAEIAEILGKVAHKLMATEEDGGNVYDSNGNKVGAWSLTG